ncbi:MAG: 4Fe-4S dicluster domain-containing protein [Oscillospiraceae bacterium]
MPKIPVLYKNKEDCCGCSACCAVCPKSAIIMTEDDEGFEYPEIDETKCVQCHKCVSVCPIKQKDDIRKS